MVLTITIPPESQARITRDGQAVERWHDALLAALTAACGIGADGVRDMLIQGELGLTMRNPGQGGMGQSLHGWILDAGNLMGAIGIPGNLPAAVYAGIQETGGKIVRKNAKALAIPISAEAKALSMAGAAEGGQKGIRAMMPGLEMVKRPGKPPLLVRPLPGGGMEIHWVLVSSVTLQATHWLTRGVEAQGGEMTGAFQGVLGRWADGFGS